jgi:hypothetical protein
VPHWLSLQALSIRDCLRVTGSCLAHLAAASGLTELCLLLRGTAHKLDASSLGSIARLQHMRVLRLGSLHAHWGGDAGQGLGQLLRSCRQLSMLCLPLYSGRFPQDACSALAGLAELRHVDLRGAAHVPDQAIASLGRLGRLRVLLLDGCNGVMDDRVLSSLIGLNQLHILDIRCGSVVLFMLFGCGPMQLDHRWSRTAHVFAPTPPKLCA